MADATLGTKPDIHFRAAEESFRRACNGQKPAGRPKGSKSRSKYEKLEILVKHKTTVEFFESILTDDTERKLWLMFMTGKTVEEVDGQLAMVDVELNPISLKAFMRAVEYKRGQPIVTVEGKKGSEPIKLQVEYTGATPEFFAAQSKALELGR